jgi:hypothetical protein
LGFLGLVAMTAAVVDGARRLAGRLWPHDLLAAACGGAILAVSTIVVLLEAMGTAGVLSPLLVLALSGLVWAVSAYTTRGGQRASVLAAVPNLRFALRQRPALAAMSVPAGLLVVLLVSSMVWSVAEPRPQFDAVAGHLPIAVQWFQAGTTWLLPYITPVSVQAQYPANNELLALWLMLAVKRDFLVQLTSVPGVLMAILGVAMAARSLGARWPAAITAALLVPTLPGVLGPLVGTNMQDMLALGAIAAMAGFVARDGVRPSLANVTAAGLAGGIAMGTRYGAVEAVPALALLLLLQRAMIRPRLRAVIAGAVVSGAGIALTGAYFYVRNLAFTGDPAYPQSLPGHPVETLEKVVFPGLRSYVQLGLAPGDWAQAVGFELRYYGPIALLLVAGVLAAPALAAWRQERSLRLWAWALLPALVFVSFLSQLGSAGAVGTNGQIDPGLQALELRYALLTLPLAAAVLAAELASAPPSAENVLCGLVLVVAVGAAQTLSELPVPTRYLAIGLAVVGLSAVVLWRPALDRWVTVAALGAALALAASAAAPALAGHYDRGRFRLPFEAAALHLRDTDHVVAVAGLCEIYSLYGPDWSRRVEYLTGRDDQLARPLGSSYGEWLASLRSHGVSALVVGSDLCFLGLHDPQAGWAAAHRDVFSPAFVDGDTVVYYVGRPPP